VRKHVLVVDDDPHLLALGRRALERAGFDVVVALTAEQAHVRMQDHRFDVAILDYFLGDGECGCDLIDPLRARNPSIRIVVLSGLGDLPELIRHAHASGADVVESKTRVDWTALTQGDDTRRRARPAVDLSSLRRDAIHGVFLVHRRNISSTARALGMKRGNLQRVLRKSPPPEPDPDGE
jgi:ActR/RegA family two-component response regulator